MRILRWIANQFWWGVAKFSGWRPNPDTKTKFEYIAAILAVLTGAYGVYEFVMVKPADHRTQQEMLRNVTDARQETAEIKQILQELLARQNTAPSPGRLTETAPTATSEELRPCDDMLANPMPRSGQTFRQPVEGMVISRFGQRPDGTMNDGIDFAVPKGTPVKAAENGVVAYVGTEISGLGKLVLIRHADDYVSAYAHNDKVLVRSCDIVKRGQVIAKAGASGSVTKPQLHFELRKNSRPINPQLSFAGTQER